MQIVVQYFCPLVCICPSLSKVGPLFLWFIHLWIWLNAGPLKPDLVPAEPFLSDYSYALVACGGLSEHCRGSA